ncbi:MerR family transcriptional regulator [Tenggerimyces flavus]|uniref:MerR family transcriptional regulator n=1 Tax=Tenggerimyces flavus TaxID=1708749 RepID=A0ABV7YDS9_9ACTN|nr:MerR family transcriptional regulator [Tenggerimyces flavus]MBM7787831.1 DNA-binding transcriptional MerR regulator [Tenggerimyces flavus]
MKSTGTELTIGELAGRFGLGAHVVRHWESVGLIAPARRVHRWRRYGREALGRVAMILIGKQAGLKLSSIRAMLDAPDRASRQDVLRDHHDQLERRIAELRAAQELIGHGLACPHENFVECPDFQARVEERVAAGGDGDQVRAFLTAHAST